MSKRHVVLCADDFGLTEGISNAILDLAGEGRISATSVMTNRPWWERLGPELRRLDGTTGIGLHLTLTAGAPLGPMPSFAPNGSWPSFRELSVRSLTGSLPLDEIGSEIERQLRAFRDVFGRAPDFVDGHQHIHVLPGIRHRLLAALRRHSPESMWLRDPSDRLAAILRRRISAEKALTVRALSMGFGSAARSAGFKTNAGFSGFSPFDPRLPAETLFDRAFTALGSRPVVMCHPGHADEELRGLDPVGEPRSQELTYLRSGRFLDFLAATGAVLVPRPG